MRADVTLEMPPEPTWFAGAGLGRLQRDDTEPADATERAEGLVTELRLVIGSLLREWQRIPPSSSDFSISDLPLSIAIVESVAAIEIAVHGWDIFESCGMPCEIPEHLALALLPVSSLVIDETLRPLLFAAPITVAASASPSDRLVALLGRQPRTATTSGPERGLNEYDRTPATAHHSSGDTFVHNTFHRRHLVIAAEPASGQPLRTGWTLALA